MFIPDQEDKERIIAYAASLDPPQTWETFCAIVPLFCGSIVNGSFLHQKSVSNGLLKFSILMSHWKTEQPLFNKAAWKSAKNILALIQNGYLSDPPGITLYYADGTWQQKNGVYQFTDVCKVPIWRRRSTQQIYLSCSSIWCITSTYVCMSSWLYFETQSSCEFFYNIKLN